MKKLFSSSIILLFSGLNCFAQSQSEEITSLTERIYELESYISVLQAKLTEFNEFKTLLYVAIALITFLAVVGSNVSFKRKINLEIKKIKKQLIEKYREGVWSLLEEEDDLIYKQKKNIYDYNRKTLELGIFEKDYIPEDWLIKGLDFHYRENYSEAILFFQKAILMNSNFHEAYYNMAHTMFILERYDEAIESFNQVIGIKEASPDAYYHMGLALEEINRIDDAIVAFKRAIELRPDFPLAYNKLGSHLRKMDRKEEAIENFNKMGDTLFSLGREEEAKEAYNSMALDLIKLGLEEQTEENDLDNPLDFVQPGLEDEELENYYSQGFEHLKNGRNFDALAIYDKIINKNPLEFEAYFCRANTYIKMGRDDEAIKAFTDLIRRKPDFVKAYYYLGKALFFMGKEEEATEAFEKVIDLQPEYPETYHKLACYYARRNNLTDVLVNLKQYLELAVYGAAERIANDPLFTQFHDANEFQELLHEFKSEVS